MSALDKFLGIMQEETLALADSWEAKVRSMPAGERLTLLPEYDVQKVTLEIVLRCMISRKASGEAQWMKEMVVRACSRGGLRCAAMLVVDRRVSGEGDREKV